MKRRYILSMNLVFWAWLFAVCIGQVVDLESLPARIDTQLALFAE